MISPKGFCKRPQMVVMAQQRNGGLCLRILRSVGDDKDGPCKRQVGRQAGRQAGRQVPAELADKSLWRFFRWPQ